MVLQRIESALARLEAAAAQSTRPPSVQLAQSPGQSLTAVPPELAKLEASNVRLREAIVMSLRQIDGLIARHDAAQQR